MKILYSIIGGEPTNSQIEISSNGIFSSYSRTRNDGSIFYDLTKNNQDLKLLFDTRGHRTLDKIVSEPFDLVLLDFNNKQEGQLILYMDKIMDAIGISINEKNLYKDKFLGPVFGLVGNKDVKNKIYAAYNRIRELREIELLAIYNSIQTGLNLSYDTNVAVALTNQGLLPDPYCQMQFPPVDNNQGITCVLYNSSSRVYYPTEYRIHINGVSVSDGFKGREETTSYPRDILEGSDAIVLERSF